MKSRFVAGAFALVSINAVMPSASADDTNLDAVIVTATRTAQTVNETLASVTVITRADIERKQARSLDDVLRGVEGLALVSNGGLGQQLSVQLRGTNANQVLVLVDGVKAGSATTGQFAFQDFPVDQIERIEIVRGPRSSLYGSEAVGGVIQIFTKKGGGALTPSFSVGGGSYGTYNGEVGLSGGGERAWFNVGASGVSSQGFDACRGDPVTGQGCGTIEPDRDGYRNVSQSARAGYRFENGAEAEIHGLHVEGHTKFDGAFQNESTVAQDVYGTRFRFAPFDAWRVAIAAARSADRSSNFKDAAFVSRFDTQRDTTSLQNDFTIAGNQRATLGFDYLQDRITSSEAFALTSRDNRGVFARYQIGLGAHELEASARHDDNQQFGGHNTGSVAWGWAFAEGLRVFVSHGTAFKAPTFNDLYWPASPWASGNPNLKPEESRSSEVGLRGTPGWGRWSVSAFRTDIDNLINWAEVSPFFWMPTNIDVARIRGAEASAAARLGEWDLGGKFTWLDPESLSPDANYGHILPRRARQSGRVDLDRRIGDYRVGMSVFGEGRRFDDLANTMPLAGYALLDLRAEYMIDRDWRIQARASNLLDKRYETAAFYNQPGRNYFITLRYQPAK